MFEIIFLAALALVWIVFAVVQDLKTHEIANWLNFSLIVFALGFRFFYSLFSQNNFAFFYQGLIGLGIFLILGNLFYYGRLFAGGDAKLTIALGTILPFTSSLATNLKIFLAFFLLFFFSGSVYTIITSIGLGLKNRKKISSEFKKQFKKNKLKITVSISFAILFAIFGITIDSFLIYIAILIFILPYIYIYAKSVDEACMVKLVSAKNLREGDWIYKDVKIGRKTIKASWDGVTKKEIRLLRKSNKKILIREGVPFSPVFLVSFILLLVMYNWILVWSFV